jgi:hypothetical protein
MSLFTKFNPFFDPSRGPIGYPGVITLSMISTMGTFDPHPEPQIGRSESAFNFHVSRSSAGVRNRTNIPHKHLVKVKKQCVDTEVHLPARRICLHIRSNPCTRVE